MTMPQDLRCCAQQTHTCSTHSNSWRSSRLLSSWLAASHLLSAHAPHFCPQNRRQPISSRSHPLSVPPQVYLKHRPRREVLAGNQLNPCALPRPLRLEELVHLWVGLLQGEGAAADGAGRGGRFSTVVYPPCRRCGWVGAENRPRGDDTRRGRRSGGGEGRPRGAPIRGHDTQAGAGKRAGRHHGGDEGGHRDDDGRRGRGTAGQR